MKEQEVADLNPGDVVELISSKDPNVVTKGPLRETGKRSGRSWLMLGSLVIRTPEGKANNYEGRIDRLTVISRAPQPLYVNHPRTHCASGDVARPPGSTYHAIYSHTYGWWNPSGWSGWEPMPSKGLTLLVDGDTGLVVTHEQ